MLQLFYVTPNKADKDYFGHCELREAHSRPMNITWKLDRTILDAIGNAMS